MSKYKVQLVLQNHRFCTKEEKKMKLYFLQSFKPKCRQCDLCLHPNCPLLTKHCIRHVSLGKKTCCHGKIAYTFQLAAKPQRFYPVVCARIMLWFSSDVRGHILQKFLYMSASYGRDSKLSTRQLLCQLCDNSGLNQDTW